MGFVCEHCFMGMWCWLLNIMAYYMVFLCWHVLHKRRKKAYNAALCLSMLPAFLYWHKGCEGALGQPVFFWICRVLAWLFDYGTKWNRQCAKWLCCIAKKSMTVKNDGNTTSAVKRWLCDVSNCTSRSCVWAGWVQIDSWLCHTAYCIRD